MKNGSRVIKMGYADSLPLTRERPQAKIADSISPPLLSSYQFASCVTLGSRKGHEKEGSDSQVLRKIWESALLKGYSGT